MENIIFDILVLNSINTKSLMSKVELISDEFFFERYSVDSIQFYESELYYSKDQEITLKFIQMLKREY